MPTHGAQLMLRPVRSRVLTVALALALLPIPLAGCSQDEVETSRAASPKAPAAAAVREAPLPRDGPQAVPAAASPRRSERPMPAFEGYSLEGERIKGSSFIGKRTVLFFFNPEVSDATVVAEALQPIAELRGQHNFDLVGVAMGSSRRKVKEFVEAHQIDYPVIDDSSAAVAGKFRMRAPVALIGVDAEGYFSFGLGGFDTSDPRAGGIIQGQLRERLRLPDPDQASAGTLDRRPVAPDFTAERLDGDEPFAWNERKGKPTVLVFFLHTCPHCHAALEFLEKQLARIPEDKRPALYGVSVQNKPTSVRRLLADKGLDYFPVLLDPEEQAVNAYGVHGAVPVVLLIDAQGRIQHRVEGWDDKRDPALVRMYLAKIAGEQVPMLLNPKGYTGSDVCGVCHSAEYATWEYTSHATAYDTLVKHGAERNTECIGCHVVGFDEPGGFTIDKHPVYLENVGCEDCHGAGGPHLTAQPEKQVDYAPTCLGCHNEKHSLGFDYATFLPGVSHAAIAALTPAERETRFASRSRPRPLLPIETDFVGSEACRSCHEAEFATWSKSPHAHAVETLERDGKAGDTACLRCHTTGWEKSGGFPEGGARAEHADLARVGCESCHGPGGRHVETEGKQRGSILALGDKCDSCVILKICGDCHDEANDPGFEFAVQEKIDKQRHGTIEAGTGKPLGPQALAPPTIVPLPPVAAAGPHRPTLLAGPEPRWTAR